jgi:hypothetical protein
VSPFFSETFVRASKLFLIFPLSCALLWAAMLYPRESALTNLMLSAPTAFFNVWSGIGILCCLLLRQGPWTRLGWCAVMTLPPLLLLQRLPVPI